MPQLIAHQVACQLMCGSIPSSQIFAIRTHYSVSNFIRSTTSAAGRALPVLAIHKITARVC
jgi:hypothetical protein